MSKCWDIRHAFRPTKAARPERRSSCRRSRFATSFFPASATRSKSRIRCKPVFIAMVCSELSHMKTIKATAYSSYVDQTPIGRGLVAAENLEEGSVVEHLEGRVVPYNKIPESDLRNAFEIEDDRWMVPQSDARVINHSCDANCYFTSKLDVIPLHKVLRGEELTV